MRAPRIAFTSPPVLHAALLCLIVAVLDGDSLIARCPTGQAAQPWERVEVRIGPIDAPEHGQPYGRRAKQALSRLVYKKEVKLDCYKQDRWRRQVCNVWVTPADAPGHAKTLDAGLAMVTQGMAWWYRAYSKEQTPQARAQYRYAQKEAQGRRAGLWADSHPIPPWTWRRTHPRKSRR